MISKPTRSELILLRAIADLEKKLSSHIKTKGNPHETQKKEIRFLGSVSNTSDMDKPVSTAQAQADADVLDDALAYTDGLVGPLAVTVDAMFDGVAKISVGTVAPTSPNTGDLWIDTN